MAFVTEDKYKNVCRICFDTQYKQHNEQCSFCKSIICNKCFKPKIRKPTKLLCSNCKVNNVPLRPNVIHCTVHCLQLYLKSHNKPINIMYNDINHNIYYICSDCGIYYMNNLKMTGHEWIIDYETYKLLTNIMIKHINSLLLFPNEISKIIAEFAYDNRWQK